jgi:glyoxylase-like metal-dependent hydrolase (beta-lactamase superfamily II)
MRWRSAYLRRRASQALLAMSNWRLLPRHGSFPPAFVIASLVLLISCAAPSAFAQVVPTSPGVKTFPLGALKISVLRDGALAFPNDATIFGLNANPAAVAKVLTEAGVPADLIRLHIDTLLIRMPNSVVLFDSGYGVAGQGVLLKSLALTGVTPNDITDILITHAHPDHVGGLVDAQGRSVFSKAKIRMSTKEWTFMQSEAGVGAMVPAIRAQIRTFEPGQQILPGIKSVNLPGHTPGHVGYEIVSEGHKVLNVGDVVHSSIISLTRPDWTLAWDSDQAEAVRTRLKELRELADGDRDELERARREVLQRLTNVRTNDPQQTRREVLQRLADTHELIFAPHFPFPGVGRIDRAGDGFRFRPELRVRAVARGGREPRRFFQPGGRGTRSRSA